ncbi:MAG: hypothetical protein WAO83_07825 [Fuerstiella sp.]
MMPSFFVSAWLPTVNALINLTLSSTVILMLTVFFIRLANPLSATLKCRLLRASLVISIAPLLILAFGLLRAIPASELDESVTENIVDVADADAAGRATVSVIDSELVITSSSIQSHVFALKDKFALEFADLSRVDNVEATTSTLAPTLPLVVRVQTPKPIDLSELQGVRFADFESVIPLEPVAGVVVAPHFQYAHDFSTLAFVNSTLASRFYPTTDEHGEATIGWVPDDCLRQKYTIVEFANSGFPPLSLGNTFTTPHTTSQRVDLTVDKMRNVTGTVLSEAGEPMPDTRVQFSFFL